MLSFIFMEVQKRKKTNNKQNKKQKLARNKQTTKIENKTKQKNIWENVIQNKCMEHIVLRTILKYLRNTWLIIMFTDNCCIH